MNESAASADSAPEGSTKIWRRAFEPGRDPGRDLRVSACDDEGTREIDPDKGATAEDEEATPNAVLLGGAFGAGGGGIAAAVIIRF